MLERFGTVHVVGDEIGAGQAIKVVNQHLASVHIVAAAEALALAGTLGLDPATVLGLLERGAAGSWMLSDRGPRMLESTDVGVPAKSSIGIFVKDSGSSPRRPRRRAPTSRCSSSPGPATSRPPRQGSPPATTRASSRPTREEPPMPAEATVTTRAERVREAAHRMRHHVLNMGEVQGQGYVGQALGVADLLAVVYADSSPSGPTTCTGPGATASCSPPGTTRSPSTRPSRRPASYRGTSSNLRRRRLAAADVRDGLLHAGHGDLRRVARARAHRGRRDGARPAPAGLRTRVFNFLSDGELDEGSTWEAAMGAAHHRLGGLTALVDMDALQADGATDAVLRIEPAEEKWRAAGWFTQRVDGNDVEALLAAFDAAAAQACPTARRR